MAAVAICGSLVNCCANAARFSQMVGMECESLMSAYVFELEYTEVIFVGRSDLENGAKNLPRTVDARHIGQKNLGITIIGILPAGTKMRISWINEEVSAEGDIVSLRCLVESGEFSGRIVDTYFVQKNRNGKAGNVPELDPKFAILLNEAH